MPCHVVNRPGSTTIFCVRGPRFAPCSFCHQRPGEVLCDGPPPARARTRKTCDARMCRACAKEVGPDRHVCPRCQASGAGEQLAIATAEAR